MTNQKADEKAAEKPAEQAPNESRISLADSDEPRPSSGELNGFK